MHCHDTNSYAHLEGPGYNFTHAYKHSKVLSRQWPKPSIYF